jgi:catechol 2,3-dioxygenase-like lactoylglutathione lyase family enzyme
MASLTPRDALWASVSHVGLAVPDPGAIARFYQEVLGLHAVGGDTNPVRLGMGLGDHALELIEGDGLDHFGLELADEGALERLLRQLEVLGVATEPRQAAGAHPDAVALRDPDEHLIELHGPVDRSGEHVADPGRRPVRLHHVTFGSPDVARMVEFYVSVLGFRVSDRMGEVFVWMRSNREHHSVAVVKADEACLDHYCFEIADWAAMKTWCDELAVHDVPITWGPGRHGPGNNLFIMFDDPAANRIELSCEMERYWDNSAEYTPRQWHPGLKTINLWGVAPSWRDRVVP